MNIMTEKALNVLEFVKIREILAQNCSTQGAKELAMDLVPSSDIVEVRRRKNDDFLYQRRIGIF